MTRSGCVFFTHNGLALPLWMTYLTGEIFPVVTLNGYKSTVKINYGRIDEWADNYDFYVNFDKIFDDPKETVGVKDLKMIALESPTWSKKSTNYKTPNKYSSSKKNSGSKISSKVKKSSSPGSPFIFLSGGSINRWWWEIQS